MKKDMDDILKQALTPTEEPDFWLNQKIISRAKERERMEKRKIERRRRVSALLLSTLVVLGVGSASVYALGRYLTSAQVAEHMEDKKLMDAFLGKDAVAVNETQNYGGYRVTLLGIVSGESIAEHLSKAEDEILTDRTYSVVAIENEDGTPMPETSDEAYQELDFFVSPLIKGLNPVDYNIVTLHGSYTEFVEDGIRYRLSECGNVECFADKGLMLCVTDSTFYNNQAYTYDEVTGEISRNEAYEGLNALFNLPVDAAKADAAKAEKIIADMEAPDKAVKDVANSEKGEQQTDGAETETETETGMNSEVDAFMDTLTPENIETYCEPVESTRQTVAPDAEGNIYVQWKVEGRGSGNSTTKVDWAFPDRTPGMDKNFGWSASDGEMETLVIQTYTINEDGTFTFVIYIPKQ